eukprot:9028667-Prorocentrum_lima.AAC.1
MDRLDVAYAGKECARAMSRPTQASWEALKRCVRYSVGHRQLIWVYRQQHVRSTLTANVDASFA